MLRISKYSRFSCPKCGGRFFGSSMQPDGSWERYCNDEKGVGCTFSFHESEDYRYFVLVTDIMCSSQEEFDKLFTDHNPDDIQKGKPT